jgi:hypothetical protein
VGRGEKRRVRGKGRRVRGKEVALALVLVWVQQVAT